jgi:hypothetical protein
LGERARIIPDVASDLVAKGQVSEAKSIPDKSPCKTPSGEGKSHLSKDLKDFSSSWLGC